MPSTATGEETVLTILHTKSTRTAALILFPADDKRYGGQGGHVAESNPHKILQTDSTTCGSWFDSGDIFPGYSYFQTILR